MGDQFFIIILVFVGVISLLWLQIAAVRRRRQQRNIPEQIKERKIQPEVPAREKSRKQKQPQVLLRHTQQAQARRELITPLVAHQRALINLINARAILLYQEEAGCSWQEAKSFIDELQHDFSNGNDRQSAIKASGADPVVTKLLLQAGCRDDAIAYFCQSTGATHEEAQFAINHMQHLIDTGDTLFFEHQRRDPDPSVLRFLLQAGYKLLAIRYYRDCTDASLLEAREAIEQFRLNSLLPKE